MKVYCTCSEQFREMYETLFKPSLLAVEPDVQLITRWHDVIGNSDFLTEGWFRSHIFKSILINRAIEENDGEPVAFFDVDVVFLKPFLQQAREMIKGQDVLVQREQESGGINAGVIFFNCSKKLRTWHEDCFEQYAMAPGLLTQDIMYRELHKISCALLPLTWSNESNGSLRSDSVLYHANCTDMRPAFLACRAVCPDALRPASSIELKMAMLKRALRGLPPTGI